MSRGPQFFDVPADTQAKKCMHCLKMIYFVRTPTGRRMPINCDVAYGYPPYNTTAGWNAGRGTSHFIDCPGADHARRPRGVA
jgi:hypothetical protein